MPRLPSGIIVEIMHYRARYHALRQRRRITERTPHERLYSLIDIVYPAPDTTPSEWSKRYTFTGHTLDDQGWLNKWREEDRRWFLDWVNQPEQRREIDHARRRLLAEPGNFAPEVVTYPYHEQFYSELYRRIRAMPMTKASPEQWQRTLARMQQQGLRAEELEWSGLPEYLKQQRRAGTPRLYARELASRIDFRHIRVELANELAPPSPGRLEWQERIKPLSAAQLDRFALPVARRAQLRLTASLMSHCNRQRSYHIGQLHPLDSEVGSAPLWFVIDPFGSLVESPQEQLAEAKKLADNHARHNQRLPPPPARPTRHYDYVTMAGGENYREWLVTLPDYQRSHFTGHYLERNLLLHMRTKERIDQQGRRLLFIEEMQSDWHQAAQRYGYDNRFDGTIPLAPYRKEWALMGLKLLLLHAIERGFDGLAWTSGEQQTQRYGRHMNAIERLYTQTIPDHLERLGRGWNTRVESTQIPTLDPWLQAWRKGGRWYVKSADGRFCTQPRFDRDEAQRLIARHSRKVELEVPMWLLPKAMREQIVEDGLPLFGDRLVPLQG